MKTARQETLRTVIVSQGLIGLEWSGFEAIGEIIRENRMNSVLNSI
jgi:hypothetical protein